MPDPWEKYATPAPVESGPWARYNAPPPAPPEEPPPTGGWAGVKRGLSNIVHMPGAILDAISKPPQDEDEEKMHTLGGPGALAIHRLIAEPMAQQHELAKKYQTQATGSETTPPEKLGFDFSLTGSTPQEKAQHLANLHNIASVVPLLGPMVGDLTERFLGIGAHEGKPDKSGALAEGATYVAAPEVAKGLLKATPAAARVAGKALPESVKNYTPSGDITELLKRTAAGNTLGRLPASSLVKKLTGSNLLEKPTLAEWWDALQPDKQMSLFKSMPKLGDTPISPETHPATLSLLQEAAPVTAEAAAASPKPFQAGGSTVPRVYTGEAVINDALTSLDKPTLMRIAKSRGIDTSVEANLIPSKAEASLVKKIGNDMTFDELADAREAGLEVSRNKPVPGENLGKKAMQEAWHYKVVTQFFPDVDLPAAMEKRAQATIAKRPTGSDFTPIYRAAAQKASPAGATDAEIKAKAVDLQAQDENMEALLRESIAQAQAKTVSGQGTDATADFKTSAQSRVSSAEPVPKLGSVIKPRDNHVYRIVTGKEYADAIATGHLHPGAAADTGGTVNFSQKPIPLYGGSATPGNHALVVEVPEAKIPGARTFPGSEDLYLESPKPVPLSSVSRAWGMEFTGGKGVKVAEITDLLDKGKGDVAASESQDIRAAQAEGARAGATRLNPSPKGFGQGVGVENTEEGARLIRERAERDAKRKGTLGEMR